MRHGDAIEVALQTRYVLTQCEGAERLDAQRIDCSGEGLACLEYVL